MHSLSLPLAATFAILLGLAGMARAETSAVSIRVEQTNKSDMNPKDRLNRTHSRTVNVFVTNNSGEPLDLKVKHIVFGRNMLNHDFVTVADGEDPVAVKPHSTEKVTTAEAKVTSNDQHYDAKTKKMTEASGATIVGVGVQVLQSSTVMAEFYDPESLKDQWGKTAPLVVPGVAGKPAGPPAKPTATPAKPGATPTATPAKK